MSFNILQSQGPFKNCLILLFLGIKNFTNFFTGTRIFTDGMPVYRWYGKFSKLATLVMIMHERYIFPIQVQYSG